MRERTFLRIMLDIIFNNAIFKTIASIVNFCNEQRYYNRKELKFLKKMPLNNVVQNDYYQKRFVFTNITGKRTNLK